METIKANRAMNSRSTTLDRTGKVPGSQTVDNILDACRESFEKLEDYFNISSDYCTIAIVLDPRFKLDFYHDPAKTDWENDYQKKETWVKVSRVFKANYCTDSSVDLDHAGAQSTVSSSSRVFKKMKPTTHGDELRVYLLEYSRASFDTDPLLWWKSHHREFPKLSRMARDYLCIAGTSAPSERAFSGGIMTIYCFFSYFIIGRRLITDTRTRLGEKTIRACMCLKSWI